MLRVILMRHGEAESSADDYLRSLTPRGKEQCLSTADKLAKAGITLDRVLCSSARRAKRSAELVAESLGFEGEIEAHRSLYLASPDHYLAALKNTPPGVQSLLLVAHNPGLSSLATHLRQSRTLLATGEHVIVQLDLG